MQHSFQDVGYGGPNRLCFPDVFHFSKKIGFLAARLGARNFTRALGYAKRLLSVVHAYADARLRRRSFLHSEVTAGAKSYEI